MRAVFVVLVLVGVIGGGTAYFVGHSAAGPATAFRTATINRGDLPSTIGATGTVEPEEVVDVGAQVMGLILEFGPDPRDPSKVIDYGSVVEKGTVLAKIDPVPYEATLEQAEATLEQSEANQLQLEAKYDQAEQDWQRAKALLAKSALAKSDYDAALASYKSAKACVTVGKATIRQNKAAVKVARTNLGYTTIKSPVRGTVIDRRVNIGQTVVASLNAPSLFLIAKDLRRMQVWASVNEADIGHIRVDMPVRFTVDAHAGQVFRGKVAQIRMNATMTQNVVTYTVVVTTDNSDGKLLPYLTANVQFEAEQRSGVLLVPNAALRWKPDPSQIDPAVRKTAVAAESTTTQDHGYLWVESTGGFVRPLEVALGTSDGTTTEIGGNSVQEGMQVVVAGEGKEDTEGQDSETRADGDKSSNPFLPKPPKGSKPPPGPI